MGWRSRLKAAYRALTSSTVPKEWLDTKVVSGVSVTQETANSIAAYWNGVTVIAGDIGVLDRYLYRRGRTDDDRERATTHQVYKLIHDSPNPYMTPQVFWETLTSHAVSWGNGYAEIEYDMALRPIALWPILPNEIEPAVDQVTDSRGRRSSQLWYRYKGGQVHAPGTRLEPEDVLHIKGLGFDGVRGYSPVYLARQSLGLAIAAERFGATLFGNHAMPGAVLEHPGELSTQAKQHIEQSFDKRFSGEGAHGTVVLEEGMKVSKPLMIPPDDAQFLESRAFQIEEVARWLNINPHKLKHKTGERPGGNYEASQIDHLTTTLMPWAERIEQECDKKLISPSQRSTHYVEHEFKKILRTDVKTRLESQRAYFDMGVLSASQIAKQENLPEPEAKPESLSMTEKIEAAGQLVRAGYDPEGVLVALGLPKIKHIGLPPVTVQGDEPKPPGPPTPPTPADPAEPLGAERALRAFGDLAHERISQYVRREAARARQAAAKAPGEFEGWIDDFYSRESGVLTDVLLPLVRFRLAGLGSGRDPLGVAEGLALGHVERSRDELLGLGVKDLAANVARAVRTWERTRAEALVDQVMALGADETGERNAA